jgi:NAD(P)-dependent dehydrogenase (short-subunit alcohol dehydrogenase family)
METETQMDPARRNILGGISTGALLAMAASAEGAQQSAPPGGMAALSNPLERYPKPPFEKQQQPWPALASRMNPKPDHGEQSYKGSGRLEGRKALLTGGDSGIGRAAAIAFAREGADVAINFLPDEASDAREVEGLIRDAGRKAVLIHGDIRSESFCQQLVRNAAEQLGGIDILVNNAARQFSVKSLDEMTTEKFDDTLKTNLYAMFWITRAALTHMRPGSSIINTSSVTAYEPSESLIDYAMTKAAIVNFSKGLAKQLAPKGIRVNAVAPGPFWTPLQVASGSKFPEELPDFGGDTPLGRPGQPAELGSVYVLLASAEASYVTGQVYGAVGGRGGP